MQGDTCDSIAQQFSVASATLYAGNRKLGDCSQVTTGLQVCLPLQCTTHFVKGEDTTCHDISADTGVSYRDILLHNPWLSFDCENLREARYTLGNTICLSPAGGKHIEKRDKEDSNPIESEYSDNNYRFASGSAGNHEDYAQVWTMGGLPEGRYVRVARKTTDQCFLLPQYQSIAIVRRLLLQDRRRVSLLYSSDSRLGRKEVVL